MIGSRLAAGNDIPCDCHGGDGVGVLPGDEKQLGVENDHHKDDGHNHHHEQSEIRKQRWVQRGIVAKTVTMDNLVKITTMNSLI